MSDVEAVARTVRNEYLISHADKGFYETVQFADPALLEIFDFRYIAGNSQALDVPSNVVLTESQATKYFGDTD